MQPHYNQMSLENASRTSRASLIKELVLAFSSGLAYCSFFKKVSHTVFTSELTDHWINSTLMCYLPPFTGKFMFVSLYSNLSRQI